MTVFLEISRIQADHLKEDLIFFVNIFLFGFYLNEMLTI